MVDSPSSTFVHVTWKKSAGIFFLFPFTFKMKDFLLLLSFPNSQNVWRRARTQWLAIEFSSRQYLVAFAFLPNATRPLRSSSFSVTVTYPTRRKLTQLPGVACTSPRREGIHSMPAG